VNICKRLNAVAKTIILLLEAQDSNLRPQNSAEHLTSYIYIYIYIYMLATLIGNVPMSMCPTGFPVAHSYIESNAHKLNKLT
jgi:hypothetical protein